MKATKAVRPVLLALLGWSLVGLLQPVQGQTERERIRIQEFLRQERMRARGEEEAYRLQEALVRARMEAARVRERAVKDARLEALERERQAVERLERVEREARLQARQESREALERLQRQELEARVQAREADREALERLQRQELEARVQARETDREALERLQRQESEARLRGREREQETLYRLQELEWAASHRMGLDLVPMNPALAEYFATSEGVLVLQVGSDSTLGLLPGDVILAIGGRPVDSDGAVRRILLSYDPGEPVSLTVVRKGAELELEARRD